MIYLVTTEKNLFENPDYKVISVQESLNIMKSWDTIQFDTETSGERNLDF